MSRNSRHGTHLELPVEVYEEMKAADEDMWRIATEAIKTYLAVETDSLTALQRQADLLAEEITELEGEIESLQNTCDERIQQKERIEDRITRIKTNRRSYEEILDDIITSLRDDPTLSITSQRRQLEAAAEIRNNGIVTEDMIDEVCSDVRARVAEQDIDIAVHRLRGDRMMNTYESGENEPVLQSLRGDYNDNE